MSSSWMISEYPKGTGWTIDPGAFIDSLKRQWPNVEIRELKRHGFSHEWTIPVPDHVGDFEGWLNTDFVVLDNHCDTRYAAEFAVWFRAWVPETVALRFFDEGYNMHIDLTPETTIADIVQAADHW